MEVVNAYKISTLSKSHQQNSFWIVTNLHRRLSGISQGIQQGNKKANALKYQQLAKTELNSIPMK
jgi:hypothetical protein